MAFRRCRNRWPALTRVKMKIDELLLQAREAEEQFWFVRALTMVERTNATVTVHFVLTPDLFVQVFLSERSGRFSLALIGPAGRLYGQDREHGRWHRHPFERPDDHDPAPKGISARPIHQFLSEVEQILIENDLI